MIKSRSYSVKGPARQVKLHVDFRSDEVRLGTVSIKSRMYIWHIARTSVQVRENALNSAVHMILTFRSRQSRLGGVSNKLVQYPFTVQAANDQKVNILTSSRKSLTRYNVLPVKRLGCRSVMTSLLVQ